ncbi:signal peptide peptidase SppA [Lysobacter pythonis]|uniref:Signal peptide peptidase SppA n=1 Tax=Solilutibacter pythonis TaxID=2483112 RepID=A0A3M2I0Q6_9GAMM|nr:signal peptide peptidase SppA [Lysobacter pythonis]RMH93753.1 signal peptide peptidase SppA [Lysobacter pythonis]
MNAIPPPPPVPGQRGPITRLFIGLWDAMNFTRRLILNFLFFGLLLLLLIVVMVAMIGGGKASVVSERTTLVLAPMGRLVEQDSRDALTRMLANANLDSSRAQVQLRDLLTVIDAAAKDKKIERVLLDVDDFSPAGFAALNEVAGALQRLRKAGKQIVAVSRGMSQSQYYLAAQADEIYLDPDGYGIVLEGLSGYRPYMREGLQDKLGIDFHLFKVGEYKSAAEPYVRDAASPEAKEADLFWMSDIWNRYLAEIAQRRKLAPATLAAGIDGIAAGLEAAQGDLNQYALRQKLVDGLKTREEVEALMTERGVADDKAEGGFRQIDFAQYLRHVSPKLPVEADPRPQVAVVVAEGEIMPGEQPRGAVGGETVAALLRDARDDDKIKAVVLRVNSPGGEVYASEQIRREVAALKKAGKPVVVSMGDVAASGGYWISMNAERIYAEPTTITGSIGIFGLIPNFTRTLDKLGVHTDGVGTTRIAGSFDPTRPLDPEAGKLIQSIIDKGYRDFTGKVAAARGKPVADVDAVARGRVWSGAQARERGLVDEFGGVRDAIADAAKRVKLDEGKYLVRYVEEPIPPFDAFIGNLMQGRAGMTLLQESPWLRGVLGLAEPRLAEPLRFLEAQARDRDGPRIRAAAHCFCAPR